MDTQKHKLPGALWIFFGLLACVFLIELFLVVPSESYALGSNLQVTFIDVGQGDSFLIRDSTGFDVLIDGGKTAAGSTVVAYLRSQAVDNIDVMVVTHADADHVGGLIAVLGMADIPVLSVLYNGYPGDTATWNTFATAVANEGVTLTAAQFPAELTWGQTTAYILNPAPGLVNPETNDASVVVLLVYGQNRLLFTGDIDSTIEATVVARGTPVAADILKVAHHGSLYSSSSAFLSQVSAAEAVISVGINSYGHPAPETLARLTAAGARILRTDLLGNIVFNCDGVICTSNVPPFSLIYLPIVFRQEPPPPTVTPVPVTGDVRITNIFYDGVVSDAEPDEYVEIKNFDTQSVQLQNWTLRDNGGKIYTFPSFSMAPGQICKIYTNQSWPESCGFNYGSGTAIWNNDSDTAFLRDSQGALVSSYTYP